MKYSFDYSNEFDQAMKFLEIPLEKKRETGSLECPAVSKEALNPKKLDLFCELVHLMKTATKVNGGMIEVTIDETAQIGQIVVTGVGYYMFGDEKDISKAALLFALKQMDSMIVRSSDNHVVIDIMLNLK